MQGTGANIQFFNRQGVYIDTVEASTTRGWLLSRLGDCTFVIPLTDPKLRQSMVEFGNLVYITHALTKPWVGVIDTDREWTVGGPKIKALTPEILLSYRHDLKVDTTKRILKQAEKLTGTAGAMVQNIIARANAQQDTLLRYGNMWTGGQSREETLVSDYYTHVARIATRAGCDFNATPVFASVSQLYLAFNFFAPGLKGADKSASITLEEGANIMRQETPMIEQGTITNQMIGIGAASTPTERLGAIWQNGTSILRFGLRQKAVTFPDVTQIDTLQLNTQTQVGLSAFPKKNPRVTVTDQSIYRNIDEGDVVGFVTHSFGFGPSGRLGMGGMVRVLGMEFNDSTGLMDLVVSEVLTLT